VLKNSKRVPSALKHGIYSGTDLLPTESRAKFRKFRRQIFAELNLLGRLEQDSVIPILFAQIQAKAVLVY
jgi:hypothetical protein